MILTGKCKQDFYHWYNHDHDSFIIGSGKRLFYVEEIDEYKFIKTEHYIENVGEAMYFSLIIEWMDFVGIYITIEGVFDRMSGYHRGFDVHIYQDGKQSISLSNFGDVFASRQEATKQAIIKANEIYNSL